MKLGRLLGGFSNTASLGRPQEAKRAPREQGRTPSKTPARYQDLASFAVPVGFRGRPAWFVQTWWIVQDSLFRLSPQAAYGWRRSLLRMFGANVGEGVLVRPTARFTYPWKVSIGDHSWIGDDVDVYSLGAVTIGANTVVSQRSYLCAGTHDYRSRAFGLRAAPVTIGDEVWLAADVFVGPGVSVGDAAIIGARTSIFKDVPARTVWTGQPAAKKGDRELPEDEAPSSS